jgi:hypothetical protein
MIDSTTDKQHGVALLVLYWQHQKRFARIHLPSTHHISLQTKLLYPKLPCSLNIYLFTNVHKKCIIRGTGHQTEITPCIGNSFKSSPKSSYFALTLC